MLQELLTVLKLADNLGDGVHGGVAAVAAAAGSDDVGSGVAVNVEGRSWAVDFFRVDDFAVLEWSKNM